MPLKVARKQNEWQDFAIKQESDPLFFSGEWLGLTVFPLSSPPREESQSSLHYPVEKDYGTEETNSFSNQDSQ